MLCVHFYEHGIKARLPRRGEGGRGREHSAIQETRKQSIASLRGIHWRFWYHLGFLGRNSAPVFILNTEEKRIRRQHPRNNCSSYLAVLAVLQIGWYP